MRKLMILVAMYFIACSAVAVTVPAAPPVYIENKPILTVATDQPEFAIKLHSNPTTGYAWFLRSYDANLLEPVKHEFAAPTNKEMMGSPGFEMWTFRMKSLSFVVPMQTSIRFVYMRPWEANSQAKQVVFEVITMGKDKKIKQDF